MGNTTSSRSFTPSHPPVNGGDQANVGPAMDEELGDLGFPVHGGEVQSGTAVVVAGVDVDLHQVVVLIPKEERGERRKKRREEREERREERDK